MADEFTEETTKASEDFASTSDDLAEINEKIGGATSEAEAETLKQERDAKADTLKQQKETSAKKTLETFIKVYGGVDVNTVFEQLTDDINNKRNTNLVKNFQEFLGFNLDQLKEWHSNVDPSTLKAFKKVYLAYIFGILEIGASFGDIFGLNRLLNDNNSICYQISLEGDSTAAHVDCNDETRCNCQFITSCCSSCPGCSDGKYEYYWNNLDLQSVLAIFPVIAANTWQSPAYLEDKLFKQRVLKFSAIVLFLIVIGYLAFKLFKKSNKSKN